MALMAERKDDQVNAPVTPAQKALISAIAEEEGFYTGQLARKVLLEWAEQWLANHPSAARRVREKAGIEPGPPDRPKSGERAAIRKGSRG